MEIILIVIVAFILIILLNNFRQEVKKNMKILNSNIINVRKELEEMRYKTTPEKELTKTTKTTAESALQALEVTSQRLVTQVQHEAEKPVDEVEEKPTPWIQEKIESTLDQQATTAQNINTSKVTEAAETKTTIPEHPEAEPKRDYEKLIGENWLNKIGIAILVIGIGFFVRYAIDKNWIGEWGRVGIGLLTGGVLIGIAHYLRKKFHAFSSVLIGGGISSFYYTISIAFHDYQLFNQTTAFAIMVGITVFSSIISIIYDRKELAIIALIGGFTSPFMVQNGAGNYIVFFTYIAILNSGILLLSYFKKWNILSKLAVGFTTLFFGIWMLTNAPLSGNQANWALFFITLFFLQFLVVSLIFNFARRMPFKAYDFVQVTGVTALFYSGVMYILHEHIYAINQSGFTLIMSLFFIGLAIFGQLRKGTDPAYGYLMIGKAITFVTLTAGIAFDGNYMALFWAAEAVVLLLIGQKTNLKILKNTSMLLNIITLGGLFREWIIGYYVQSDRLTPFTNGTFFTGLFVIAGFALTYFLINRSKDEDDNLVMRSEDYKFWVGALLFGLTYLTFLFELIYQLDYLHFRVGSTLILWIFHLSIILAGVLITNLRKSTLARQIFFFIGCIGTLGFLLLAQQNNYALLFDTLQAPHLMGYYYLHFVLTGLVISLLFMLRKTSLSIFEDKRQINWFLSALGIIGLVIATVELDLILGYGLVPNYSISTVFRHSHTEGFTILWGIYSFILMIFGMKKKNRVMRVLALAMFSITLLKLFIFDIQEISEAGKIIAFISLGVFLLVISFMYQKLKALIVGNEDEA